MKKKNLIFALLVCFTLIFMLPTDANAASINKKTATITAGKTLKLKISGTKSTIKWSSSNPKIAKVSKSGTVTGLMAGKTTITATYGKKKSTCKITVKYKDIGYGNMYLSTPNGTSEGGKTPTVRIAKDTMLYQIGLNVEDFNYKLKSYIYVDHKLLSKMRLSNTQTSINLTGNHLKKGTHIVEVIQYKNNNVKLEPVTYKSAKYKIAYK